MKLTLQLSKQIVDLVFLVWIFIFNSITAIFKSIQKEVKNKRNKIKVRLANPEYPNPHQEFKSVYYKVYEFNTQPVNCGSMW